MPPPPPIVDYNIEVAHIYMDQEFNIEQERSLEVAKSTIAELESNNTSYCVSILIDNYNPHKFTLNIDEFLTKILDLGIRVDYLIYEADLVQYGDTLLEEMGDGRSGRQYKKYIQNTQKYPCSFLLAIWHLLRLGVIQDDSIIHQLESSNNQSFYARKSITILPNRFSGVEKQAQRIITSTVNREKIQEMEYIYY